jgi:SAM-dependent methyltransferase
LDEHASHLLHRRSGRVTGVLSRVTDAALRIADYVPTPLAWRSWHARRAGRSFDRRHRTDTQGHVDVAELGVAEAIAAHAVWYEPSSIPKAQCALRHLGVRHEEYDFLDVGSGKGLVPMLAARYPFRRVVGVEASRELHEVATANLRLYEASGRSRAPVTLLNTDALTYRFGEMNHVVYLYNPFDDQVLREFVARLLAVPQSSSLVVAYVNPVHRSVIEETGAFGVHFDGGSLAIFHRRKHCSSAGESR